MPLLTREASSLEASTWALGLDCLRHRVSGLGNRRIIALDAPAFVGRFVTRGTTIQSRKVNKSKDQIYMRAQASNNLLRSIREGEENILLSEQMGVKLAAYQYGMCSTHHASVELFVYILA